MNRQQARAEQRRIDKHLEKMAKLEETTNRLVELGVLKKRRKPIMMTIKKFIKDLRGNNLRSE